MSVDSPAWPCVPHPFADEAFGSWFGRVAARYRITVSDLARAAAIPLEIDAGAWLIAQPPTQLGLSRLSRLSGLPESSIEAMRTAPAPGARRFRYCFKCLFLNPVEVESPYWHAAWLEPDCAACTKHPERWEHLSQADLGASPNMHRLLGLISRRHASRVRLDPTKDRGFRYVSTVRGHH